MNWRRILFFASNSLIVLISFSFFYATYQQLYRIEATAERAPVLQMDSVVVNLNRTGAVTGFDPQLATYAMLEAYTIQNRYHRSRSLLMSQLWIKYLGFLTGMVLSFMGGIFIVARYREPDASLQASHTAWSLAFQSGSPGFFLVLMGTILMLSTIAIQSRTEVRDAPTYLIPRIITDPADPNRVEPIPDLPDVDSTLTGAPSTNDTKP